MGNEKQVKHTMEFYSAPRKKEVLSLVTVQMNVEDTMLSEVSQSQNTEWPPGLCKAPETVRLVEAGKRATVARGQEEGEIGLASWYSFAA